MNPQPTIAATAFLIADPARTAMLMALVDGRAWPAGELAYAAGVSAQTASSHLKKLVTGGLLTVETQGRHRYYRLAGAQVVATLKHLASIGPVRHVRRKAPHPETERLRFARCCYDHLAGQLGVEITKRLLQRGYLAIGDGKAYAVTPVGIEWFGRLGLDITRLRPRRHGIARQCLDWTEREHHLAGPLGTQLMTFLCEHNWLRRPPSSRAVEITPKGWKELQRHLGIDKQTMKAVRLSEDADETAVLERQYKEWRQA